jgi:hypothetical protein
MIIPLAISVYADLNTPETILFSVHTATMLDGIGRLASSHGHSEDLELVLLANGRRRGIKWSAPAMMEATGRLATNHVHSADLESVRFAKRRETGSGLAAAKGGSMSRGGLQAAGVSRWVGQDV